MNKPKDKTKLLELSLLSRLGYEKIAMAAARVIATDLGLRPERAEDLATALSEAVLNAMEHGNRLDDQCLVFITFTLDGKQLLMTVKDQGKSFEQPGEVPNIEAKLSDDGGERGWGLFLIEHLVNRVEVIPSDKGTSIELIVFLGEEGRENE